MLFLERKSIMKIKNIFVRPSWPLIFTATILVAVTFITLRGALLYVEWVVDSRQYVAWTSSDNANTCKQIEAACFEKHLQLESRVSAKDKQDIYERIAEEMLCKEKSTPSNLNCNVYEPIEPSVISILNSPWSAFSFVIPMAFFSMRRFYDIKHLGWERVTALLSITVGLSTLYYILQDGWIFNWRELPTVTLVIASSAMFVLCFPVIFRHIYRWLSEGFKTSTSDPKTTLSSASGSIGDDKKITLSWAAIKPVAYACLIFLGVLLSILFFPEKSAKAMISGLVSSVSVVLVVWVFRRLRK